MLMVALVKEIFAGLKFEFRDKDYRLLDSGRGFIICLAFCRPCQLRGTHSGNSLRASFTTTIFITFYMGMEGILVCL